jgi:Icc protein
VRRAPSFLAILFIVAAAVPGRAQVPPIPPGPCERVEERIPEAPLNVELVTVTEKSFAVTWLTCDGQGKPLPSDTTVAYGTTPNPRAWRQVTVEEDAAFHHAVIGGLQPGVEYFYQVYSGGLPGRYDRYHPGSFTTLTLPGGRLLFRFAVLADLHLGEKVSGLATSTPTPFPPAYTSDQPYSKLMARAAVDEINARGIRFAVLPADNTSHGELAETRFVEDVLDRLEGGYAIARGAHDRPGQYEQAEQECPPDGDCFRFVFFPNRQPGHVFYGRRFGGFDFIVLDSANLQTGTGEISDRQLEWLRNRLQVNRDEERPAVILFHHPVSEWSTTLAIPPLVFGVNQQDAQQFLQAIAPFDVRMVINAHTHRNWISYSPWTGRMPILEMGPSKEYPGGYSVIRVYQRGFVRNFYRLRCGFCRRWIETTRWEYLGQYPHYTTGSLRDRNFVHRWRGVPGVPSLPFNIWPPLVPMEA